MSFRFVRNPFRSVCAFSSDDADGFGRAELDSHADTCTAGPETLLLMTEGVQVKVSGFSKAGRLLTAKIASVAMLYTDILSGSRYVLVMHQALYFKDSRVATLLNPNQLRANSVQVFDTPRQFDGTSRFAIVAKIDDNQGSLVIPLDMRGVMSGFPVRKPTWEEYETLPHVTITAADPWEPYSEVFAEKERAVSQIFSKASDTGREVLYPDPTCMGRQVCAFSSLSSLCHAIEFDDEFHDRMIEAVNVAADDMEGDGLDGHEDPDVYSTHDDVRRVQALETKERDPS